MTGFLVYVYEGFACVIENMSVWVGAHCLMLCVLLYGTAMCRLVLPGAVCVYLVPSIVC